MEYVFLVTTSIGSAKPEALVPLGRTTTWSMWFLPANGLKVNRRFITLAEVIDPGILGKLEVHHKLKRFSTVSLDALCLNK